MRTILFALAVVQAAWLSSPTSPEATPLGDALLPPQKLVLSETPLAGVVAGGTHDLILRIYEARDTGSAIWEERHEGIDLSAGLDHVAVGRFTPLYLATDRPYWLGLDVDGEGEISPRSEIVYEVEPGTWIIKGWVREFHVPSPYPDGVLWVENISDGIGVKGQSSQGVGLLGESNFYRGVGVLARNPTAGSALYVEGKSTVTGQIVSTLATGIPPLDVTSTTLNANLNADLLDGKDAAEFLSPAEDYGRPGAAAQLYEGLTSLTDKYVEENQPSSVNGTMIVDGSVTSLDLASETVVDGNISPQANIAPTKISGTAWTALNDGSGSGLDADYLDGLSSENLVSTLEDHGRYGVAATLYEGTVPLSSKYVEEGQPNSISGTMVIDGSIASEDITDGTIVDEDVSLVAAILPEKIHGTAWTSLNDGSGSGLDADLLDGQSAQSFLSEAEDYGRQGVADTLYEGAAALQTKYAAVSHGHFGQNWQGPGRGLQVLSSNEVGIWGEGAATLIGTVGSTTGAVLYNTTGTGVAGQGPGVGVFGSGGECGVRGYADGATYFGAAASNANSSGTGLLAAGNNAAGSYLTAGSGVAGTGRTVGVYGRAAQAGNAGQAGGYFTNGNGDFCYVAFRSPSGSNYKVYGSGSVSTVMPTSRGPVTLISPESPEAWFEDYGSGELRDGFCHVDLDPTFLECTTIDESNPLRVFVQLTSSLPNGCFVRKGKTGFDVLEQNDGRSEATFDYRIVARWKGWEGVRFSPGAVPLPQASATARPPGSVSLRE